ncbi:MAG: hypothetical protein IPK79_03020 [Vampirovibrionales bacterium]|nr:hypothetical protein [Vampirovibrionales bacterium]
MSLSACVPAPAFARFEGPARALSSASASFSDPSYSPAPSDTEPDQAFVSGDFIPVRRALAAFGLGLGATLLARKPFRAGFQRLSTLFPRPVTPYNKSLTLLLFQNPLASLSMQAMEAPRFVAPLALYSGATAAGYLATTAVQGYQEAWVRRQETGIRVRLLSRLQGTFAQSLRDKQAFDDRLLDEARTRLRELLTRNQAPIPPILQPASWAESSDAQRRSAYQPTHRQWPMPGVRFGNSVSETPPARQPVGTLDAAFALAGALTGVILHGFLNAVERFRADLIRYERTGEAGLQPHAGLEQHAADLEKRAPAAAPLRAIEKTLSHTDAAALVMLADRLQSKWLVLGYGALVGIAALGKLAVDGLREIRVTQANAATEYRYQRANWLQLDPGYHRIAETETLNRDLRLLQDDLPSLKRDPALLKQRVQTILANVGRNSAPPYFPMTPMVGIVPARS